MCKKNNEDLNGAQTRHGQSVYLCECACVCIALKE